MQSIAGINYEVLSLRKDRTSCRPTRPVIIPTIKQSRKTTLISAVS